MRLNVFKNATFWAVLLLFFRHHSSSSIWLTLSFCARSLRFLVGLCVPAVNRVSQYSLFLLKEGFLVLWVNYVLALFRLFFSESKKPFLERVSNTQAVWKNWVLCSLCAVLIVTWPFHKLSSVVFSFRCSLCTLSLASWATVLDK